MADDKRKRDGRDRAKVAADQQYELAYFAQKHGLTADEARFGTGPGEGRSDGRGAGLGRVTKGYLGPGWLPLCRPCGSPR